MLKLVRFVLELLSWALILRVLVDFIPAFRAHGFGQLIVDITEPLLRNVRRFTPPIQYGDRMTDVTALISVMVLYIILHLIR
ncbi:MAG: YggT family protein [Bacillota bacterium]|jgi:uncharacterized protein YggT (Ycf19 family)